MWNQIERFVRRSAKRADDVSDFLNKFKPMMACGTLNPRYCKTGIVGANAIIEEDGSVIVKGERPDRRDFMLSIIEAPQEEQEKIVDCLYSQSQRIVLHVRDRIEREKEYEGDK